ncbi:DUF3558 family protein [Saccharothrix sp.]|uniref:DUF3558 family protein n=1 Tax=Saccharothrix sp. TaxID=1873460 RepID=UPI0028113A1F|nr:DUF3558 family protein [Saccharothrix sp.]
MIRAFRRVAVAVGLAVAVSACTTQITGSPVPVPNPTTREKATATAKSLLGDLPAVDPCGYLDTRDVERFGQVTAEPPESLDSCRFTVKTSGGTSLDLQFGSLDQVGSERELEGKPEDYKELRIVEEPEEAIRCARLLVFEDLVTLSVSVDNFSSDSASPAEMCRIADHAAKLVADRVLDKKVEHREFGAKSVGRLEACGAVRASLAKVPGLTSPKAHEYPAAHQCRWSNDGRLSTPRARVTYAVGKPTEPGGENTVREDVAGRPTVIIRSSASSVAFCAAETTHIPFERGLQELAVVTVTLPSGTPADQACAAVKEIAAEAWAKLPK